MELPVIVTCGNLFWWFAFDGFLKLWRQFGIVFRIIILDVTFLLVLVSVLPSPLTIKLSRRLFKLRIDWSLNFSNVILCFTLRLWVDYFIYFEFNQSILLMDIFNGFSLVQGIGISNIYLKVTIERNWRSQNFDFKSLKNLFPGQFLESSNSCRYQLISKLFVPI